LVLKKVFKGTGIESILLDLVRCHRRDLLLKLLKHGFGHWDSLAFVPVINSYCCLSLDEIGRGLLLLSLPSSRLSLSRSFRSGRSSVKFHHEFFEKGREGARGVPVHERGAFVGVGARCDVLMSDTTANSKDRLLVREVLS